MPIYNRRKRVQAEDLAFALRFTAKKLEEMTDDQLYEALDARGYEWVQGGWYAKRKKAQREEK